MTLLPLYILGAVITLAGIYFICGLLDEDYELVDKLVAVLTWPLFLVALIAWGLGKLVRKARGK